MTENRSLQDPSPQPLNASQTPKTSGLNTVTGKTFADVFDSILTDPTRFLVFSGLLLGVVVLGSLATWVAMSVLGLHPTQVQINAGGTQILFQTTSQTVTGGVKSEYLLAIHPQGWERTGINVRSGQHLSFDAEGEVCIDAYGLFHVTQLMHELEKAYQKPYDLSKPIDEQSVPEASYTDDIKRALSSCLNKIWTGPEGFEDSADSCPETFGPAPNSWKPPVPQQVNTTGQKYVDQDFPGRTKNKLRPSLRYGRLVGAISRREKDDDKAPVPEGDLFDIGKKQIDFAVPHDGEIMLNVNDVVDKFIVIGAEFQSKYFYHDNLGYFLVKIVVGP